MKLQCVWKEGRMEGLRKGRKNKSSWVDLWANSSDPCPLPNHRIPSFTLFSAISSDFCPLPNHHSFFLLCSPLSWVSTTAFLSPPVVRAAVYPAHVQTYSGSVIATHPIPYSSRLDHCLTSIFLCSSGLALTPFHRNTCMTFTYEYGLPSTAVVSTATFNDVTIA